MKDQTTDDKAKGTNSSVNAKIERLRDMIKAIDTEIQTLLEKKKGLESEIQESQESAYMVTIGTIEEESKEAYESVNKKELLDIQLKRGASSIYYSKIGLKGSNYARLSSTGYVPINIHSNQKQSKDCKDSENETEKFLYNESEVSQISKIGQGNFGTVWKAEIKAEKRIVCLKTPKNKISSEEYKKEMLGLMSVAGQENIMKFHGIMLTDAGKECFLLELCELGSLDLLHDKYNLLDKYTFWKITRGMFLGLAHLHYYKIVHRDIACRNLLITNDFEVRLADFGLAVRVPTGVYNNSPFEDLPWPWMPPEAFSMGTSSYSSDIWAAGVTLWEIFTKGGKPYAEESGLWEYPPLSMMHKIGNRDVILEIPEGKKISKTMRYLVSKCLEPCQTARPTAREVIELYLPGGANAIKARGTTELKSGVGAIQALQQTIKNMGAVLSIGEHIVNVKIRKREDFKRITVITFTKPLDKIPGWLARFEYVRELSFAPGNIEIIPDFICRLNYLQKMTIPENNIRTIPSSIGGLRNLQYLAINQTLSTGRMITNLEALGELSALEELDLSDNILETSGKWIEKLEGCRLRKLNLSNVGMESLPGKMGRFADLNEIDLTNHNITSRLCLAIYDVARNNNAARKKLTFRISETIEGSGFNVWKLGNLAFSELLRKLGVSVISNEQLESLLEN